MSTRIKDARKAAGLTQEQLADATGMTQKSVSQWETGSRKPNMDTLRVIATTCNTTVDYLLGLSDNPSKMYEQSLPHGLIAMSDMPHHYIPMMGSVAAGVPIYMDECYDCYVDSPREADFALRVSGDSMSPTYQDGDVVYIKAVPDVEDGQICVVAIDDSCTLKHLYHISGGVQLVSDNPAYPPMIFTAENSETLRVLGLIVGFTRIYKRKV